MPIEIRPKRRSKNINFAIGMIVKYSTQFDSFKRNTEDGVIIKWDYTYNVNSVTKLLCTVPSLETDYFDTRNISQTLHNQPHYMILTENNCLCYIHQGMRN